MIASNGSRCSQTIISIIITIITLCCAAYMVGHAICNENHEFFSTCSAFYGLAVLLITIGIIILTLVSQEALHQAKLDNYLSIVILSIISAGLITGSIIGLQYAAKAIYHP